MCVRRGHIFSGRRLGGKISIMLIWDMSELENTASMKYGTVLMLKKKTIERDPWCTEGKYWFNQKLDIIAKLFSRLLTS